MTKRNNVTTSWATDAVSQVVDAELDSGHPSGHGGVGKTAKGWVSETEPQSWENFNIKLREDRQRAILTNGRVPWDEEVSYKVGAITQLSGVLYVTISGAGNLNKAPNTQTTYWSPIKFTTAANLTATVADMQNKFNTHTTSGQNSHNDDIVRLGGNTKNAIDFQNSTVTNRINAHIPLRNNPHADTAANIGTLPMLAGGNFTGAINYLDNLSLGTNCELMTNISTFVMFRSNAGAIGVGVADYDLGGRWQRIVTVESFPRVSQLYNPTFVMPKPDVHFPLMSDFKAFNSLTDVVELSRPSTLAFIDRNSVLQSAAANAPTFEIPGYKLSADTSLIVTANGLFGSRDGCISYTLNNIVVVKDVQFSDRDITSYCGKSGNVKNFRVWSQRLTPRQKLRIPR